MRVARWCIHEREKREQKKKGKLRRMPCAALHVLGLLGFCFCFCFCVVQGGTHWSHWALALDAALEFCGNGEEELKA